MNWSITKALVWKEWRESRGKFLLFFCAFHLPTLIATLSLIVDEENRFSMQTMPPKTVYPALEIMIFVQSMFVLTVGLFLIIFYGAGTVSREIASRRISFILERPVTRWQALSVKYAMSGLQIYALAALTPLTTLLAAYAGLLILSRTVSVQESLAHVIPLAGTALKIGLWRGVVGLMVFSVVFSFSVAFEHWWINMGAGVASVIAMFYFFGKNLILSIVQPAMGRRHQGEFSLKLFGEISTETFLVALLVAAGCFILSQFLFQRKEIA
ncbi:MAG: hypothetical protein HY314_05845 [Acidobacteria bacterium]|nr:hypothetical protein [Acidobacteriota bacterium]